MIPAPYFPPDEARSLKHNQMFRDSVQRHWEIVRNLGNTRRTAPELLEDGSARGICDCAKNAIERGFTIFNHMVDNMKPLQSLSIAGTEARFDRGR